ncbi:methionyl-tRNA formyltransferase [Robiginitalea myxolifaciens]|uniref:Methionyl-tRNA formyltransferase n=1 Tax=Robiginitalea myxolifaciens TaxID=400055 RepID=A0A1I6H245_9FLAO|nr:formyltransferase family protein [Robiginitalea myxolifaciens]SFR48482.1 methionyl-tRNA formyltransferase [Robiginitalea myxolifaciens]
MSGQQHKAKIWCIGANLESFHSLKYLVDQGCEITGLITLPSGPNPQVSDYYDLHPFCEQHGIETLDSTNVNSPETLESLGAKEADYLFTLGWSQIFREDFIRCFSAFIVGTHPSKLPYGRGRAPLPWTILEGLEASAVSFFKIDTGVDTGMLLFQRDFNIPTRAYVGELYDIVARELSLGFLEIYKQISEGVPFDFLQQSEEGATVRGKRTPADGLLSFDRSAADMDALIRAVSKPYPGAYTYYKDEKVIFWEVREDEEGKFSGTRGQILTRKGGEILVQFADGNLWLGGATLANGEIPEPKFFKIGDKLGYSVQDEIYKLKKGIK